MSGLAPRPCDIFSRGHAITLLIQDPCVDSGLKGNAARDNRVADRHWRRSFRIGLGPFRAPALSLPAGYLPAIPHCGSSLLRPLAASISVDKPSEAGAFCCLKQKPWLTVAPTSGGSSEVWSQRPSRRAWGGSGWGKDCLPRCSGWAVRRSFPGAATARAHSGSCPIQSWRKPSGCSPSRWRIRLSQRSHFPPGRPNSS